MKEYFLLISRSVAYLVIGSLIFFELVNLVQFKSQSKASVKHATTISQDLNKFKKIEKQSIDNQLEQDLHIKVNDKKAENNKTTKKESRFVFFKYVFDNNSIVIPILYVLIYLAFLIELLMLSLSSSYKQLLSFFSEKKLDNIFLYSSQWASNAPTVLGVIGTIYSFGLVVGSLSDTSSLAVVFKENFANAAQTTILGGMVYVVNLFINIFITKNLTK